MSIADVNAGCLTLSHATSCPPPRLPKRYRRRRDSHFARRLRFTDLFQPLPDSACPSPNRPYWRYFTQACRPFTAQPPRFPYGVRRVIAEQSAAAQHSRRSH